MTGEWRETTLDQLGRIVTGKTPPSSGEGYFGGDIPFVTPTDFDGRRVIDSTGRYLTEEGALAVGSSRLPSSAVMVSCIGSDMGKAAIAGHECVTNQQINSIVVESGDDPLFVYYNLSTRKVELRAAAGGSAQPILNKSGFGRLDINLPPPDEQRAIAHILGTLDDRIELNRRMNETLEAMARALFKSWFVDFDPVRAKDEGRDPGLPQPLADLFPNSFEDSELGEIPQGWSAQPLYDIAMYINGAAYAAFQPNGEGRGLPIVKIAELKAGVTSQTKFSDVPMPEKYGIASGDILFSWSGNPDTSIDTFVWSAGPAWLNQHIFKVLPLRTHERAFVLSTLKTLRPVFAEIARNKQTTGLGHVTVQDMKHLLVARPNDRMMSAWRKLASPLHERAYQNALEILHLSKVRDALLRKLISGEVRVTAAERFRDKVEA